MAHIKNRFPGDHPRRIAINERLAFACEEFVRRGLADPKFVSELASGSEQKFWACVSEALVAELLYDKVFGERSVHGKGPDFLVMNEEQRVWIEVICPEPIDLPDDWLNLAFGKAISVPHEQILLRWTSAIKSKAEALIGIQGGSKKGYLKSGIVLPDDAYVIAVNACRLRNGEFPGLIGISQFPYAAEAVFPIGPMQVTFDAKSLEVVDRGHQHRPFVLNKNRAEVPAYTFLDPRFDSVSAVWAVDLNGGSAIGNREPKVVVHNPNAKNPIPVGFLPADDEYIAREEADGYLVQRVKL